MKLPPNNLNYPIRILVGSFFGSGFLIRHTTDVYLVTAKHVLFSKDMTDQFSLISKNIKLICHPFNDSGVSAIPRIYDLDLELMQEIESVKSHPTADIVVIKFAMVIEESGGHNTLSIMDGVSISQDAAGVLVQYDMAGSRKFAEVEVTNDIFVLGYPGSLSGENLQQIDYNFPLARKGIVAGKNKTNRTLILDCPVYGGNSGGLVLEMNETSLGAGNIHLIGVVVQFVPFFDSWQNKRFQELQNTNIENSGYSVALPLSALFY